MMNKEEIKFDHFKDIEELIQHLEMWYEEDDYYAYDRYFHLRDARIMGMYIYQLQQENKQLKEMIDKERKINTILYREDLQQRIDKAIKYIEKNSFGISYMEISELKEILKGSEQ